jgi:hypothetical protein
MNKTLPVFEMRIENDLDSELEVDYTAFVDAPAIERNFQIFHTKQAFSTVDEKRIVYGPAMIANMPIYRRDNEHGEYYVVFSKPTIYQIAEKFFTKDFHKNFNIMHSEKKQVDGVVVFQSFISDPELGILPMKGYEDLADGTLFFGAKVNNDEVWADVKSGKFKGFSVEGLFSYGKKPKTPEQVYNEIKELLSQIS